MASAQVMNQLQNEVHDTQEASDKLEAGTMETETQPLLESISEKKDSWQNLQQGMQLIFWAGAVIIASSVLINYNKYLMHQDRFPFPMALVMLHNFTGTLFALVLLKLWPSLFPALTEPSQMVTLDRSFIFGKAGPVAFCFAGSLVLSNTAYRYANVAFLQMIKQTNVVTVYLISLVVGTEVFKLNLLLVLISIMLATACTIRGELNFSMLGLMVQGACGIVESTKIVIQGVLLAGKGQKLDPLTFVLVISPLCFCCLSVIVGVHVVHPLFFVQLPTWSNFVACKWLLIGNVVVAFSLNLIIANFLKRGSPLSFTCTNLIKDAMIVIASSAVLGEAVSKGQSAAFCCQLFLIGLWSLMKSFPDYFQDGVFLGLQRILSNAHGKVK
eukprot:TRINITY_DN41311_c0_g1_i1.p1 TRINITY_DN41311_c0_g1~~TRINITY_DN41311_c0_g1_i1.p1  ORF type:complete len:385 (+),score=52.00 TRINITY_DN41311_c0_g1_i1:103-1257(+)